MVKNPNNIPIKEITFEPSTIKGDLDSYSIADGQNARVIMAKLREDLGRDKTPELLYRIYQADRLETMLTTGTDRDDTSHRWDEDTSTPEGDKTFLDTLSGTLHETIAKLAIRYIKSHGEFCIGVYRADAFDQRIEIRITGVFKDKEPQKRLNSLQCVYLVKAVQN